MKNQGLIFFTLILIAIIIIIARIFAWPEQNKIVNDFVSCAEAGFPIMESYPRQCIDKNQKIFVETIDDKATSTEPKITSPKIYTPIKSPVEISGQARGNWFFEGSLPIKIIDQNGKTIGEGNATAQGDWMTENYVPFQAKINFGTSSTNDGFILIKNDNPSGLDENETSFKLPIIFKLETPKKENASSSSLKNSSST